MLDEFLNFFRSFDEEGYDKKGFNRQGFNREGVHRNGTPYDRNGFDVQGYNAFGLDHEGYDRDGYDSNGFDREGYNREGYNRDGYDRSGFGRDGYDRDGYGRDGFNRCGVDRDGFNRDGFDAEGFGRDGYDHDGYDRDGYGRDGFNREGFDSRGFGRDGFDRDGCDRDGFDRDGYDLEGYDHAGFDKSGYDRGGYDCYGFSRKGIWHPTGIVWWQTLADQIPSRLLEEKTEPKQEVSSFSLVTTNPIGLLGFSSRPQVKAIQKRAKEIERLSQIGLNTELEGENPYCRVRYDSMVIKEAAEILSNPKKVREADFFWIDFDKNNKLEKCAAERLANKQLHAAYSELQRTRKSKRILLLLALLALEQEESRAASEAVAKCWGKLSSDASLFSQYDLDGDYVAEKIVALLSDIAERKNDWDIPSAFCKATGKYSSRYFDVRIAPVLKTVENATKKVDGATKTLENAKESPLMKSKRIDALKSAIDRGESSIKEARSNDGIPSNFMPLSEAVNEFAQAVRNAAVAVITTSDDVDKKLVSISRSMLNVAEKYANTVALQHRIKNDSADLDQLVDDMRYVKERDDLIDKAAVSIKKGDFKAALAPLKKARNMARSMQEIQQLDQFITVARKGILAQDFERQMNAGQLRAALNTLDEALSLEDDWSERIQLCKTRDQLAMQVDLIERAGRNRYRW